MRFEIALIDTPATPRREITVVGLDSVLLESTVTSEMPRVFAEDAFIEILEGGNAVDVVGDDPGPVIIAALTSGPLGESFELAGSVSAIVPALAAAALALVLEIALEGLGE